MYFEGKDDGMLGLAHLTSGRPAYTAAGAVACGPNGSAGAGLTWCRDGCGREQLFKYTNYGGGWHDEMVSPYTNNFGSPCDRPLTNEQLFPSEPVHEFPNMDTGFMPDGSRPPGYFGHGAPGPSGASGSEGSSGTPMLMPPDDYPDGWDCYKWQGGPRTFVRDCYSKRMKHDGSVHYWGTQKASVSVKGKVKVANVKVGNPDGFQGMGVVLTVGPYDSEGHFDTQRVFNEGSLVPTPRTPAPTPSWVYLGIVALGYMALKMR